MKLKDTYLEIGLFGLCLLNVFTPIIPQLGLYFIVIGCAIKRLPKEAVAFCCLVFLRDINHAMFFLNYHIPLMSYVTVIWGLWMMRDYLFKNIKTILSAGIHLWIIMFVLLFSMLLMGNMSINSTKLIEMFITGTLTYIAYLYILSSRSKINFFRLALYCTIFSVFLLQLNIVCNHYGTPSSLFDFGFYRDQVGVDMYAELANTNITYATHYQFFGMVCAIGFSLCFALNKLSFKELLILLVFNIIVIAYTGARQYLIIMMLLFALYTLINKGSIISKVLIIAAVFFAAVYALQYTVLKDYFDILSDKGLLEGSGRDALFFVGVDMFLEHPLLGVGFGGYNFFGNYAAYPHNMIVEVLAELGVVGLIVILFIIITNKAWRILFASKIYGVFMIYIILAYFIRSMISASLASNIAFFAILSAANYHFKIITNKAEYNIKSKVQTA